EDSEMNLWVGTVGFGVIEMPRNGQVKRYDSNSGLLSDHVRALYQAHDGALWIGTEHGVNRLQDNQLTGFTAKDGLSGADVRVIHEDRSGTVWIGTYDGGLN